MLPLDQVKIAHLEATRTDVRDEIKRRIEQRDRYTIALFTAVGALVALSATSNSNSDFRYAVIAAPLVTIFFVAQILYSYRVHNRLARFIRIMIDPEMETLCGTEVGDEWETYYQQLGVNDTRQRFYFIVLGVVTLASIVYVIVSEGLQNSRDFNFIYFIYVTYFISLVYVVAALATVLNFWGEWNYARLEVAVTKAPSQLSRLQGKPVLITEGTRTNTIVLKVPWRPKSTCMAPEHPCLAPTTARRSPAPAREAYPRIAAA